MRILYINTALHEDYLNDMIFHGLYSILGNNVVDFNKISILYKDYNIDRSQLYGRGFTIYQGLIDIDNIDRTDIELKIRTKYFDIIIYHMCYKAICHDKYLKLYDLVTTHYNNNRIILLEGEDLPEMVHPLYFKHLTFKRELYDNYHYSQYVRPISFSIPKSKIQAFNNNKLKCLATVIPGKLSTYKFTYEQNYYDDYQNSYIGITTKKGGWDCLRHYEILANSCIPYFINLQKCPKLTLFNFPKDLCIELLNFLDKVISPTISTAVEDLDNIKSIEDSFNELINNEYNFNYLQSKIYELYQYCKYKLTTEEIAKYMISSIQSCL